jgi:hypothetical protein
MGSSQWQVVTNKINRPSLVRWAIGFLLCSYLSTSKASPNDSEIVIIVIIIVGKAVRVLHGDGIIAQRLHFGGVFSRNENNQPRSTARRKGGKATAR